MFAVRLGRLLRGKNESNSEVDGQRNTLLADKFIVDALANFRERHFARDAKENDARFMGRFDGDRSGGWAAGDRGEGIRGRDSRRRRRRCLEKGLSEVAGDRGRR